MSLKALKKSISLKERQNAKIVARKAVEKKLPNVFRPVVSRRVFEILERSGNIRYRLLIGYDKKGKKVMPSFGGRKESALDFQTAWNSAINSGVSTDLSILEDVAQVDVRWAISEFEKLNSSLREAVNFFISHAYPDGGFLTFKEAMEKYYEIQKSKNLSASSVSKKHNNYQTYFRPMLEHFGSKPLMEIVVEDVKKYLTKRGSNWSVRTYNDHLNYGRRFWNVLAASRYCSAELNP